MWKKSKKWLKIKLIKQKIFFECERNDRVMTIVL